ncbi:pyridoxine kinase [Weissella beninensis]|uniref:pyridoxal kinase n=1 Tax=Periweissella beninensis TaxID=504936 RepID=A0ABT0VGW3_9LACO|nr:bifunctional hydroxymethylpyrimidine kinase/phosphomethylpyrimidine kinase [Periweissella beninensis]MBM7544819.1 pyridoxine kinase [Periweissella beninensis]MCM2437082.1 bifunctional hydroxymethylpyrimidine kinase/phosphomethylpyrimidine kinase [Periweissella beninensis]
MQVTLVAQDLSALGQLSMGIALPIFRAVNLPTIAAPTTIYSTQTEEFGQPVVQDMQNWLKAAYLHWQTISDLTINNVLIGYIGHANMVGQIGSMVQQLQPQTILLDPVMGDQGALYPGFDQTYVTAMQALMLDATILTPNWTEAQLLTKQPIKLKPSDQDILQTLTILTTKNQAMRVIITGIERDNNVGVAYLEESTNELAFIWQKKVAGHFYGTGDAFSALLSMYLQRAKNLTIALEKTMAALTIVIAENNVSCVKERKYGLQIRQLLGYLANEEEV